MRRLRLSGDCIYEYVFGLREQHYGKQKQGKTKAKGFISAYVQFACVMRA